MADPFDPEDPAYNPDLPNPHDPNDKFYVGRKDVYWNHDAQQWRSSEPGHGSTNAEVLEGEARRLESAPGAQLDVSQSAEDAQRLAPLIAQLQQQAATGSGAWEKTLQQATEQSKADAMALGVSQQGQDIGDQLRGIGNGQAAATHRGDIAGTTLRAQTQQDASRQLASLLGQQGGLEAQQAGTQQAVRQGVRAGEDAYVKNRKQEQAKDVSAALTTVGSAVLPGGGAIGGAVGNAMAPMSSGGPVPGKAPVFGDDEANDTVPAMLSPKEIVLPRSVTLAPDAPEQAAEFVRAVQAQNGGGTRHHFDFGGPVPAWKPGDEDPTLTNPNYHPGNPLSAGANENAFGGSTHKPTTRNGGLLDTKAYNANRNDIFQNSDALQQAGAGLGPSVAPQMVMDSSDAGLTNALRQQQGGKTPGGDAILGAVGHGMEGGARAAGTALNEQQRGSDAFAQAMLQQRARDLGVASAQQQAQWRNSLMNQGISLQDQATLRNLFSGAGQAAQGTSDILGKLDFKGATPDAGAPPPMPGNPDEWASYPGAQNGGGVDASDISDWNTGAIDDGGFAAHGGEAVEDERTRNFLAALRRSA